MDQTVYEVDLQIKHHTFKIYVSVPNYIPNEYHQFVIKEETNKYIKSCVEKINYKVVNKYK